MRFSQTIRFTIFLAILFASSFSHVINAGQPKGPKRFSQQRRQANMLMLRFQDALANNRWEEALSMCSGRVRTKATDWKSVEKFFNETMPVEHVLSQDFGSWMEGPGFYGLVRTISPVGATPVIQWCWGITLTNGEWVVDYPPVTLDDYVAAKKAAFEERDRRMAQIREDLKPQVKGVKTILAPATNRFVLGQPMLFRLQLTNAGPTSIHYMDHGVRFMPLTVLDEKGNSVPYKITPLQIPVGQWELAPKKAVTIAEIDINKNEEIPVAGQYSVQFDSALLEVGQPLPYDDVGPFSENLPMGNFGFLGATNKFPSNVVRFKVRAR